MDSDQPGRSIARVLGAWIVVVLATSIGLGFVRTVDEQTKPEVATSETTLGRPDADAPPPAADQVRIAGPVGGIVVVGNLDGALGLPQTFDPVERGSGNGAEIGGVTVAGTAATLVWDGGRPLALSGSGGIALEAATYVLAEGVLRVEVGGTVNTLRPGDYDVATPVAVARGGGLAEPRDAVTFAATEGSTLTFTGSVSGVLPRASRRFTGPGRVEIQGLLTVEGPDGALIEAHQVVLPEGAFELEVSPFEDGFILSGLLQGEVQITQ